MNTTYLVLLILVAIRENEIEIVLVRVIFDSIVRLLS